MAFSSCVFQSPVLAFKTIKPCNGRGQKFPFLARINDAELCRAGAVRNRINLGVDWSFRGGSRLAVKPKVVRTLYPKSSGVNASFNLTHEFWPWIPINIMSFIASCYFINFHSSTEQKLFMRNFWNSGDGLEISGLSGSQLASSVFTLGTVAVLPFYTLMVLAPKSELTKKSMESSIPYIMLGVLYAYLLYLSWTPETVRLIFASNYLLPELTSIGKMFASEMTLASAWIHLLAVDLFAARHVFHDGLENQIETRHSVSLCLFFCPIGILTHIITKGLTKTTRKREHGF